MTMATERKIRLIVTSGLEELSAPKKRQAKAAPNELLVALYGLIEVSEEMCSGSYKKVPDREADKLIRILNKTRTDIELMLNKYDPRDQ